MKTKHLIFVLVLGTGLGASQPEPKADVTPGPPLVLPPLVVTGHLIPASWFEVSWQCGNPLPFCPILRAWISKVGWGTPAEAAGIKKGDALLVYGGRAIGSFTAEELRAELLRGHTVGDRLELVIQTPGQQKRTVVILFKKLEP